MEDIGEGLSIIYSINWIFFCYANVMFTVHLKHPFFERHNWYKQQPETTDVSTNLQIITDLLNFRS
jgi:hypothetical protein